MCCDSDRLIYFYALHAANFPKIEEGSSPMRETTSQLVAAVEDFPESSVLCKGELDGAFSCKVTEKKVYVGKSCRNSYKKSQAKYN